MSDSDAELLAIRQKIEALVEDSLQKSSALLVPSASSSSTDAYIQRMLDSLNDE